MHIVLKSLFSYTFAIDFELKATENRARNLKLLKMSARIRIVVFVSKPILLHNATETPYCFSVRHVDVGQCRLAFDFELGGQKNSVRFSNRHISANAFLLDDSRRTMIECFM